MESSISLIYVIHNNSEVWCRTSLVGSEETTRRGFFFSVELKFGDGEGGLVSVARHKVLVFFYSRVSSCFRTSILATNPLLASFLQRQRN